ncbi:IclR family transcriptional regulator [Ramlibacter sp.]|uniref:IclR family transcriptional regulator n=1 Tax=Ramlibacter sp. TaxID=1917967 RepID=UPI0017C10B7A|nr:IclR family transcriptional regulator [Ramlibacter sp.]MBA2673698.1 IclR family transcriptional regulator [Ramlibacter sp.]
MKSESISPDAAVSSLHRAVAVLRALGAGASRVSELGKALGYTQATTHRLLQQLVQEGLVEQLPDKRYALSLGLFELAARAGERGGLRGQFRPALLRLGAALGDSVFLLVRAGFDAMCLDRWEGPFPIRSFTGDIGGRVPLGIGQGAMAILANLAEAEREEVIRHNVPRLAGMGPLDGVYLRTEIAKVRRQGYAATSSGLIEGMAGVGVPVFDARGEVVAALSVGTLSARLEGERLQVVVDLLRREADLLAPQINPFDRGLRRPAEALGAAAGRTEREAAMP